ncbi:glycosyltransferase [Nesterenkonia lutea]|uniref:D-inositol 3-phosphate glycosyltransferase n=1 Tax=Nesterenkonia lutea TaxID=272919 RepID=A0ABR9JBV8_9MICC|nr:glycosyltransferase [Nesterenkonia lutea]MBE1523409.1 glycosyltransferase involved in cell wall biosynthesis [Nesterenkonia lutea]
MSETLNFPVPGFVGSANWGNQWYLGNSRGTSVGYNNLGQLSIDKTHKHTSHAILNATSADLKRLSDGRGVPVGAVRAYSVHLNGVRSGGIKVQVAIHAYGREGIQHSRMLVENGERLLYVPEDEHTALVVSLRMTGSGSFTVRNLEFNPSPMRDTQDPGLHILPEMTTRGPSSSRTVAAGLNVLMPLRQALYAKVPLDALMTREDALHVAGPLIDDRRMLDAKVIVEHFDLYEDLPTTRLRVLFWHGKRAGYIVHALACIDQLQRRGENEKDALVASKLRSEFEFHRDPWAQLAELEHSDCHTTSGPVIHMVGKAMPEKQTGYTVRTKHTVDALRRAGIQSVVAVQVAGNHEGGLTETIEHDVDGVPTVMFGGAPTQDTLKGAWMQRNADELLELVKRVRPSVIHAHSDFTNGVLATHIGTAAGIPVVYESRGFWEETWISRVGKAQGWEDIDRVFSMYGVPDLYKLRRDTERRVRERADRVVTLAETMKNFILGESPDGSITPDRVHLVRNAVDGEDFPVHGEDSGLRETLGIPAESVVVGYISSMVEYEGVETLIDGFNRLSRDRENVRLLLVGDGMHLNKLKKYAEGAGVENIVFTGRIPHDRVAEYYRAIDIFVVPRRRSRVTELVTPLKPFEAFATGRAVVMSDVSALAEIAADSGGAARLFRAGDDLDLSIVLRDLVDNPDLRKTIGLRGAKWVREHRSWAANASAYSRIYEELANA